VRWIFHSVVALWLGVAMPLLCVPGISSNHDHGPHAFFSTPYRAEIVDAHADGHDHHHASQAPGLTYPTRLSLPLTRLAYQRGFAEHGPESVLLSIAALLPALILFAPAALTGWHLRRLRLLANLSTPLPPWRPPGCA
jgi:hypothetical protein